MSKYIGPVCKLCRREGEKLFLKGERCSSFKCSIEKKKNSPGQHGASKKFKKSEYGIQLREKQKAKRWYFLLEKQFKNYFISSEKKKGITGDNLILSLENRLDNLLFKIGFVSSRKLARQVIVHGHIKINDKLVDKPSYVIKKGDKVSINKSSVDMGIFHNLKKENIALPDWFTLDKSLMVGEVTRIPNREEINIPVSEQLIVELYSK